METKENLGKISPAFMEAMQPETTEETNSPDVVNDITEVQPEVEQQTAPEVVAESGDVDTSGEPQGDDVIEVGDSPEHEVDSLEVSENTPANEPQTYEIEGVQKLVDFMKETGGTMQDYLHLNRDTSTLSETQLMKEYFKNTRPHLDNDDVNHLVKEMFDINEEELDEGELRNKNIAKKEQLFNAKTHLDSQKDKYFNEIRSTKGGASVEDLAIEKQTRENNEYFIGETNKFFGEDFKGFNFSLNKDDKDLNVRYRVENKDNIRDIQSDLNKILGRFLGEDGRIEDVAGYHKAMFAASNPDKVAQMFFDQGHAMAIKEVAQNSKNTDFTPQHHEPKSTTKLQPGQSREIEHPNTNTRGSKVQLRYGRGN